MLLSLDGGGIKGAFTAPALATSAVPTYFAATHKLNGGTALACASIYRLRT